MKGTGTTGSFASKLRVGLVIAATSLLCAAGAQADPIGPGCGSCNGGIYTLTYGGGPISNDGTNSTYRITLTVQPDASSSSFPTTPVAIDSVAVKVSSSSVSASLFASPDGQPSLWVVAANQGLNAGGCSGGGSGFNCAGKSGGASLASMMAWTFDIVIANTVGLNTTPSIKARYINSAGGKTGDLVSEGIPLQAGGGAVIPEPASLLLLGSGLGAVAAFRRKKG